MTQASQATPGDTVLFHYTGSLKDGTVFDSSSGRDPLRVTLGSGQVIRGVDEALVGMAPGDEKSVTVAADEAYGQHRPELLHEVQREQEALGRSRVHGWLLCATMRSRVACGKGCPGPNPSGTPLGRGSRPVVSPQNA